jgi:Cu2+-exporting ATPase
LINAASVAPDHLATSRADRSASRHPLSQTLAAHDARGAELPDFSVTETPGEGIEAIHAEWRCLPAGPGRFRTGWRDGLP